MKLIFFFFLEFSEVGKGEWVKSFFNMFGADKFTALQLYKKGFSFADKKQRESLLATRIQRVT